MAPSRKLITYKLHAGRKLTDENGEVCTQSKI